MPSHPSVKGSVFWVAVAEVILGQPEIVAPVGESEAAGVPEHVGMDVGQPGAERRDGDQIVDGLGWFRSDANSHGSLSLRVASSHSDPSRSRSSR
jgi:hypothetical protein